MKKYISLILLTSILFASVSQAQSRNERQVIAAVEALRKAMIDADSVALSKLISEHVMYSHSGGKLENKAAFIRALMSGKSDFVTIELSDQIVKVSKKAAIVRHTLNAQTNDSGKPATIHLIVMLTWQKVWGKWKLLGRQAVKVV
jgi:hypothetical protein